MSNPIISKVFQDKEIFFDKIENELYLNATKTAKTFNKEVKYWLRSAEFKNYIEALDRQFPEVRNSHFGGYTVLRKGGNNKNNQGTWIHKSLIILFARWLSPEFAVWCDLKIEEILSSQNSNSESSKTQEDPIEKRVQLIQQSEKLFISFEKMFQKIGITEKTELAITTNRAVKNETTVDFITLSGKNGLEVSERYYTVTELCNLIRESNDYSDEVKKLVSTKNLAKAQPRNLNLFLEKNGFQTKELNEWKATKKGEEFSKFVQNKSSTSSKNVYHLNWKIDVLREIF